MSHINTSGLTSETKNQFINNCLSFYVEATTQFYQRFPLKKFSVVKEFKFLNPKEIFSGTIQTIAPLVAKFPNIIKDSQLTDIDSELRLLQCNDDMKKIALDEKETEIGFFWEKVNLLKKGNDTQVFPLITHFVKGILCLPHSSANVERVFSTINIIKTKQRNRCSTETLDKLLHAKNYMKNSTCVDFQVEKEHLNIFNQNIYDFK